MIHVYIWTLSLVLVVIIHVLLKSEILKFKHSLGPFTVLTQKVAQFAVKLKPVCHDMINSQKVITKKRDTEVNSN